MISAEKRERCAGAYLRLSTALAYRYSQKSYCHSPHCCHAKGACSLVMGQADKRAKMYAFIRISFHLPANGNARSTSTLVFKTLLRRSQCYIILNANTGWVCILTKTPIKSGYYMPKLQSSDLNTTVQYTMRRAFALRNKR